MDGALYSDDDPVQMVLGVDVIGRAISWNDTSITERYLEACQSLLCGNYLISCLKVASCLKFPVYSC